MQIFVLWAAFWTVLQGRFGQQLGMVFVDTRLENTVILETRVRNQGNSFWEKEHNGEKLRVVIQGEGGSIKSGSNRRSNLSKSYCNDFSY